MIAAAGLVALLTLLTTLLRAFLTLDRALCKLLDADLVVELALSQGPAPNAPSPDDEGEAIQSASARRKPERHLRRDKLHQQ